MRVVVLGAGGLLGRHLVEELSRAHRVTALDRAACDVTDRARTIEAARGAELIVNSAAFTDVDGAESRADDAWRLNALGAENAALAAVRQNAALVHLSTDFVFAGDDEAPIDEFATPAPRSIYARSKFAGEQLVARTGCRHFLVRVQALYGRGGRGFSSRLVDLLRAKKPLSLDGERRVQPTPARAAARQLARLVESEDYGTYHLSCAGETTWAGFARAVCERLGIAPEFREVKTAELRSAAARPRNCVFAHRMLKLRGLYAMPDWRAALDEYLDEEARR